MLAQAAVVTPVVTAVWLTSMRKKWVGGMGSRTLGKKPKFIMCPWDAMARLTCPESRFQNKLELHDIFQLLLQGNSGSGQLQEIPLLACNQAMKRPAHLEFGRSHKLDAAPAELWPLVGISSSPVRGDVLLVLRGYRGHGTAEIAGEGFAIAVELHEGVHVGPALAASQRAIPAHVHHLEGGIAEKGASQKAALGSRMYKHRQML